MAIVQCTPIQGPVFTVTGDAPEDAPVCQDDLVIACQTVRVDRNYLDKDSVSSHQLIEGIFMDKKEIDEDGTAFFKVILYQTKLQSRCSHRKCFPGRDWDEGYYICH